MAKLTFEDLKAIVLDAYDRGYFDGHSDDSDSETDEKDRARAAALSLRDPA